MPVRDRRKKLGDPHPERPAAFARDRAETLGVTRNNGWIGVHVARLWSALKRRLEITGPALWAAWTRGRLFIATERLGCHGACSSMPPDDDSVAADVLSMLSNRLGGRVDQHFAV